MIQTTHRSRSRDDATVLPIIVNWNCATETLACLEHLRTVVEHQGEIVIVDNGSDPTDLLQLQDAVGQSCIVLINRENRGYAGGVNRGMEYASNAGHEWVWLTNPDSRPDSKSLTLLLSHAEDDTVAIGPNQVTGNRSESMTARPYLSAALFRRHRTVGICCNGCASAEHSVDMITGTGLMLRVKACTSVGPMDERFFHYKEEFEFVDRLRSKGRILYVCETRVWHQRGGSLSSLAPTAHYYRVRNELLFLHARYDGLRLAFRLGRAIVRPLIVAARDRRGEHFRAALAGIRDGIRGRGGQRR